ncbi:DUF4185 domain-containing protein [Cryptosporangium arvum]|uniref:DUF4185 domain-containing protein n=1 Tax=Cryptosporangium arvum TaxID=80871 RepID=UPI0004B125A5|nr:DUF4185 domain-containing protein [Cryptosporangium arvum]
MPTAAFPDAEAAEAPPNGGRTRRPLRRPIVTALLAYLVTLVAAGFVIDAGDAQQPAAPPPSPSRPAPVHAAPTREPAPPMSDVIPDRPGVARVDRLDPVHQQGRVTGRDNGQSTRYGDRSVWVFADTELTKPDAFLSNTAASTVDLTGGDGITLTAADVGGTAGDLHDEFLPWADAERTFERAHAKNCVVRYCGVTFALWPGPVIADPQRHRVIVLYHKLCRGGAAKAPCSQRYGQDIGSGVAAVDMRTYRVTRLTAGNVEPLSSIEGRDPTLFFGPDTRYASAAVVAGDDVYVYGDCRTDDVRCRVAKVPLAKIADRSAWRFYGGDGWWSADPADAVATIRAGGAGNTVLWNPALEAWVNVYMEYGSHEVRAQVGGAPYGPWSDPFTVTDTDPGEYGTNYAAYAHPEYAERDGLVQYVTYYQQFSGAQKLLRVTFSP